MEKLLYILLAIIAIIIFLYMKNDSNNRKIEKYNRNIEKQEELLRLLKNKSTEQERSNTLQNNEDENKFLKIC
jgi:cell division protein FtsL